MSRPVINNALVILLLRSILNRFKEHNTAHYKNPDYLFVNT